MRVSHCNLIGAALISFFLFLAKQPYRVSHFNLTGIALTAFFCRMLSNLTNEKGIISLEFDVPLEGSDYHIASTMVFFK